ncbi:Tripartite tricarboxylate transporter family receptor [compost metagenome]
MTTEPDGYTLSMAPVVIFRLPHVQKMRYDPLKDLTYVSMIADYNFAVAVKKDAKWQTMQELITEAKADKRGISYGTTGIYGSQHLTISELARVTQSNWTHVPYKGDAEAITALLSGSSDVAVLSNTLLPYVQSGQMRVLATLSEKRAADFPDAPTLKEIGYPVWSNSPFGVIGPAGMKPAVVKRLDDAFRNALKDPKFLNVTRQYGMVTNYMGPEQYSAYAQKAFKSEGEIIARLAAAMKNQ